MINFVVMMADDLTLWQMKWLPRTQKRLARTGVSFYDFYVCLPLCEPSRATMMTGQYPHNHGIWNVPWDHLDMTTCLQRVLQLGGYKVGFAGKPLNSWRPSDGRIFGYDYFWGVNPQHYYNYDYRLNDNPVQTAGSSEAEYYTTACTQHAINFIQQASEPFCSMYWPHPPHFEASPQPGAPGSMYGWPNASYKGCGKPDMIAPREADFNTLIQNAPSYINVGALDAPTIAGIDRFVKEQAQMLFELDVGVNRIVDALVAKGVMDRTIIIFTSDNGQFHGQLRNPNQKQDCHVLSSRVPLIISGPPSLVAQNMVCESVVSQVDIIATIHALSGVAPARVQDGVSLSGLMLNPHGVGPRTGALVEYLLADNIGGSLPHPRFYSLVQSDYIYTEYPDTNEFELTDRNADPRQMVNQAGNPVYAAKRAQMASVLSGLKTCSGGSCRV